MKTAWGVVRFVLVGAWTLDVLLNVFIFLVNYLRMSFAGGHPFDSLQDEVDCIRMLLKSAIDLVISGFVAVWWCEIGKMNPRWN